MQECCCDLSICATVQLKAEFSLTYSPMVLSVAALVTSYKEVETCMDGFRKHAEDFHYELGPPYSVDRLMFNLRLAARRRGSGIAQSTKKLKDNRGDNETNVLAEAVGSATGTAAGKQKDANDNVRGVGDEDRDREEDLRANLEEILWKFLRKKCFPSIPALDKSICGDKNVGPYSISQYLGEGAFGSVRLATDTRLPVSFDSALRDASWVS